MSLTGRKALYGVIFITMMNRFFLTASTDRDEMRQLEFPKYSASCHTKVSADLQT